MKVSLAGSLSRMVASERLATAQRPGGSFEGVLNSLKNSPMDTPHSLLTLEQKILRGNPINATELIAAQITIHGFNLKVELVSKGVESLTSSLKRMQQQS